MRPIPLPAPPLKGKEHLRCGLLLPPLQGERQGGDGLRADRRAPGSCRPPHPGPLPRGERGNCCAIAMHRPSHRRAPHRSAPCPSTGEGRGAGDARSANGTAATPLQPAPTRSSPFPSTGEGGGEGSARSANGMTRCLLSAALPPSSARGGGAIRPSTTSLNAPIAVKWAAAMPFSRANACSRPITSPPVSKTSASTRSSSCSCRTFRASPPSGGQT